MEFFDKGNKYAHRLYYSIAEVSQITKIEKYVIRYWEKEFSQIKPKKNKQGVRSFKKSDLEVIFLIKKLLYEDLYTIAGAKKFLEKERNRKVGLDHFNTKYLKQELLEIQKCLKYLRDE